MHDTCARSSEGLKSCAMNIIINASVALFVLSACLILRYFPPTHAIFSCFPTYSSTFSLFILSLNVPSFHSSQSNQALEVLLNSTPNLNLKRWILPENGDIFAAFLIIGNDLLTPSKASFSARLLQFSFRLKSEMLVHNSSVSVHTWTRAQEVRNSTTLLHSPA